MPDLFTREAGAAPVVDHNVDTRRVTVRLCRWNEPRQVIDPGNIRYREAFAPGAVELADNVHVVDHHHGDLIGRADPASWTDDGVGPTVDLVLARTAAAGDTLALIEAGVIRSVSMEYERTAERELDGVMWRTARVHGVAFAFRPAHTADILTTRETPTTTPGDPAMTDTYTPPDTTAPADPGDRATPTPSAVSVEVLNRSLDELRDDLTRTFVAERPDADATNASLNFRSLGEYAAAVYDDPSNPILRRALADQITDNNPGVIPPAWLSTVAGIVDRGAPLITAFGRAPLPDSGMEISYPYFDGDLAALVEQQATEKTGITSVRVDLKKGSADIETFAGGSDISYQLIRRSSPEYLSTYLRIMSAAYTLATDARAAAIIAALSTASAATWDPATGDLPGLAGALFIASAEVEAATGAPAGFALAGADVFQAAGVAAVENSTPYGTNNVAGTGAASTLNVSVSGLPIIYDANLPDGALIVSNNQAATWHSEGPFTVTAEDVERLGQNVAVWGMGALVVTAATGIVTIAAA